MDPTSSDRQELLDKYLMSWGAIQVAKEILEIERKMNSTIKDLEKKRTEVDNFKIGA